MLLLDINPLDYCYKSLNCHLELMSPKSDETQLILKYLTNSWKNHGSDKVTGIFRVQQENGSFAQEKSNRCLLWHGTDTAHMISILRNGLQVDPPHAHRTGYSLGKVRNKVSQRHVMVKRRRNVCNVYITLFQRRLTMMYPLGFHKNR